MAVAGKRRTPKASTNQIIEAYQAMSANMLSGFAHCRMLFDTARKPLDFVYLEVNPAFETLTGLKNVAGKRVSEVVPGLRQAAPMFFQICGEVVLTGVPRRFVYDSKNLNNCFEISAYRPRREHFVTVFNVITTCRRGQLGLCGAKSCNHHHALGGCGAGRHSETILHLDANGVSPVKSSPKPDAANPTGDQPQPIERHSASAFLQPDFIKPGASNRARQLMHAMTDYVYKNYHRTINLDAVAGALKMNRFYLSTQFSKNTGMTFQHFLQDVRLSQARELLRDSRNRVGEVAYAVGYASLDAFRHAFIRHEGLSPEAWRAKL